MYQAPNVSSLPGLIHSFPLVSVCSAPHFSQSKNWVLTKCREAFHACLFNSVITSTPFPCFAPATAASRLFLEQAKKEFPSDLVWTLVSAQKAHPWLMWSPHLNLLCSCSNGIWPSPPQTSLCLKRQFPSATHASFCFIFLHSTSVCLVVYILYLFICLVRRPPSPPCLPPLEYRLEVRSFSPLFIHCCIPSQSNRAFQ